MNHRRRDRSDDADLIHYSVFPFMPKTGEQSKRTNPHYQAQAILSGRARTEAEMRDKLARKGFTVSQIEPVIHWLYQHKLLNDEGFAREYVTGVLQGRAVGPRWILQKLYQKKVPPAIASMVLGELFTPERERELVRTAAKRWQGRQAKGVDMLKLSRFLLSRGFSPEVVRECVGEFREAA